MGAHPPLMSLICVDERVDLVDVRRGSDVVPMFSIIEVCVFAVAEAGVPGHAHVGEIVDVVATA